VVNTPDTTHHSDPDLQEAATHHDDALRVIRPIADALSVIPALCAEIRQLRQRLAATLTDLYDLIAAAKATLGAHADGEPDPFYYLRDELEAQGHLRREDEHRQQRPGERP
jgi:hypothetical protein